MPASAIAVETVDGRIAYEGTPEEPILKYEDCLVLNKAGKQTTKFWTVDLLRVEQEGLNNTKKPIATVTSPARETLPRLPVWGSPNGWDHWGRPWAYMDAPHNNSDLKILSVHEPRVARVTVAVLVNCKREPQYFPNLDVAKSAAAASTWRGKKGKVVDGNGNYLCSDKTPTQAARQVLPRFFASTNPAVEAIFKGWMAYRNSKVMWRPNPAMLEGDVTPDGCIRARPAERISKHRPFFTVSATLPRDPTRPPPAVHLDTKEFPDLEKSPNQGIGGIQGSNDVPRATTRCELAFVRPVDGQGAPRPKDGVTGTVTTTPATPTTSAAPSTSAANPLNGRQHQQALVQVDRMSDAQVKAAQKVASPKPAGPASTPKKSDPKSDSSKEEAMETDTDSTTQKADTGKESGKVTSQRKSDRSASEPRAQKDTSSSQTGKTASTSSGAKSQTAKSSTDKVQQALKKAGGLEPPRSDLAPIAKRSDARGKKAVDYRQEDFPAPTLRVVQPGGGHLKAAPAKPKKAWVANVKASQAEVMGHIRGIARGGRRHAEYRDHSHWLRDWDDTLQQLRASQEALLRLQEEETHVDEGHVGALLATIYALQHKSDELKEEVRKLTANRIQHRKQLKEARNAKKEAEARADAAEKKLQGVEDALQQAVRERDAARAGQPQLPAGQPQAPPDQGTLQLRQELDAAKQELEQHRAHRCAPTDANEVAQLRSQLQEAQANLQAWQAPIPVSEAQTRLAALEQEYQKAQARIQELMDQGQTLQDWYRELQNEHTVQVTQLEGRLRVGQVEMKVLQDQLTMESDFSKKRAAEIERLGEEIKQLTSDKDGLKSEKDKLEAELRQHKDELKDASRSATATQATYQPPVGTGVPTGTPYGSPLPSHAQMLAHFNPNIPLYGMAAAQAAYAGPGGQAQGFSPHQPPHPPMHQFQGSPQLQHATMNLIRLPVEQQQESPLAPGSDASSQDVVSPPVTTSAPST